MAAEQHMSHIDGYDKFDFNGPLSVGDRVSHVVYHRGDGPPIIVIQELPGIGPQTIALANKIVDAGFAVYMPHLFGPLRKTSLAGNVMRLFCLRREYHLFAKNKSSPIVNWLRALCQEVQRLSGHSRIGSVGMCLTGGFALTLMAEDGVVGGVASQPSLPVFANRAVHMSADEIAAANRGMAANGPGLAMRYEGDVLCKASKLEALNAAFGENLITHTIAGKGHSLLTMDWSDEAFATMLDYFRDRFQA